MSKVAPKLHNKLVKQIYPKKQRFYNHISLSELQQLIEIPSSMNIFCIERCPYRKILSWANMQLSMSAYKKGGKMISPKEDVKKFLNLELKKNHFKTVNNIDLYKDHDGKLGIKTILRYENLSEDLNAFLENIGIKEQINLPHAKKGIMSNTLDLREFFSKEHIEVINDAFHEEFEMFGYKKLSPE